MICSVVVSCNFVLFIPHNVSGDNVGLTDSDSEVSMEWFPGHEPVRHATVTCHDLKQLYRTMQDVWREVLNTVREIAKSRPKQLQNGKT